MADILVIDDEENLSYSIQLALERSGHTCRIAETGEAGMAECARRLPDLALVDLQLPDMDGLDLMARLKERSLDAPVVVITAHGTVDNVVVAMKRGAIDYIQKPLSMEELLLAIDRCLENRQIRNQLSAYQQAQRRESGNLQIVGECEKMRQVLALADRISTVPGGSDAQLTTILLLGETGTGKEVVGRYIHHHSRRKDRLFVHVNCTAVPEHLFESELFGHEPGAFTNAKAAKKGLLEMAHEGTLFLDEIGDMPPTTQAKLLVAIENGRFRRLGGTTERSVRMQVMAATNGDLQAKVDRGEFRADLYYRLKVFCVELPSLRERGDDLFLLADHFIEHYCRKFRKPLFTITPQARAVMTRYAWPGNIRELANVLQRAVLVSDGPALEAEILGIDPRRAAPAPSDGRSLSMDFSGGGCTLAAIENRAIRAAVEHAGGNISEAARLLGLTRGALRHRLDKLGLQ